MSSGNIVQFLMRDISLEHFTGRKLFWPGVGVENKRGTFHSNGHLSNPLSRRPYVGGNGAKMINIMQKKFSAHDSDNATKVLQ